VSRPAVRFYDEHPDLADLREEVIRGLSQRPKSIPPKFFYDARGSTLFDAICDQPEYYPTRTEMAILARHAAEIAAAIGPEAWLVELGCGASRKIRLLLEALRPHAWVGVDISRDFLRGAAQTLACEYPWLEVHAVCTDFSEHLHLPLVEAGGRRRVAFFPGSSIGNFDPPQAERFLRGVAEALGRGGALLIGVDLQKDPAVLDAAYNDAAGVTADFNRNLLVRIRDELGADVDPEAFAHRAFYDAWRGRVEMHLVSLRAQTVRLDGHRFPFQAGETLHTENSYKYTLDGFEHLARRAGYRSQRVWTDERGWFSVHLLQVVGGQ